jgi:hypothetical protein
VTRHRLYIGNKFTGVMLVPDDKRSTMFHIHWPDRQPSDIVNLARAKDAAERWAVSEAKRTGYGGASLRCSWSLAQSSRNSSPMR